MRHVDAFVHRTGRTGRAGKTGLNMILTKDEDLHFMYTCEDGLKIDVEYTNSIETINDMFDERDNELKDSGDSGDESEDEHQ